MYNCTLFLTGGIFRPTMWFDHRTHYRSHTRPFVSSSSSTFLNRLLCSLGIVSPVLNLAASLVPSSNGSWRYPFIHPVFGTFPGLPYSQPLFSPLRFCRDFRQSHIISRFVQFLLPLQVSCGSPRFQGVRAQLCPHCCMAGAPKTPWYRFRCFHLNYFQCLGCLLVPSSYLPCVF